MKKYLSTLLALATLCSGLIASQAAFVPINGTYNGLFSETNGVWQQSSGAITVATTSRGKYSARLQIGPRSYFFSGALNQDGQATKDILRFLENPLTVQFRVDSNDPDLIVGSVTDGTWTADLFADRSVFNGKTSISPDAGQYTMVFLGDFTSTNNPGGASFGTITIDKAGRLRFSGWLADGTPVSQSTTVSKTGQWPFYFSLYLGGGTIYGWLLFNGSTDEDLSGDVTWIRPEMAWTWFYPRGFAVIDTVSGSHYVRPPRGTKVLDLTTARIEFNGGNLDRGITNHIVLDSNNRVLNQSANGLRLSFSLSNGSFGGSVKDPITFYWIPFKGVVLQKNNVGAGFFPGWDQTGEVWLQGE
jgi:hypothetical protein